MKKGTCQGCGEYKTLLSKTLCHQCVKDQYKQEERPVAEEKELEVIDQKEAVANVVALDFTQDQDLLCELTGTAHRNYRTLSNEILALLRASSQESTRPSAGAND